MTKKRLTFEQAKEIVAKNGLRLKRRNPGSPGYGKYRIYFKNGTVGDYYRLSDAISSAHWKTHEKERAKREKKYIETKKWQYGGRF